MDDEVTVISSGKTLDETDVTAQVSKIVSPYGFDAANGKEW